MTTDRQQGVEPARARVRSGRWDFDLWLYDVALACCAVEYAAATLDPEAFEDAGVHPYTGRPQRADVLVVSGTVTDKTAPLVRSIYDAMPEPRHVLSFGSCANSGGPYWDSYCVTPGIDTVLPVDLHVPGCPPRPETLLDGVRRLGELLDARDA